MKLLVQIIISIFLLMFSNTIFGQISFINCIDCDVEDSILVDPTNSILMYGGVNEVEEGLILLPYNTLGQYSSPGQTSGFMTIGINSGQIVNNITIDTTGGYVVSYCVKGNDSTSFIVGYRKTYFSNSPSGDSSVAWIGKLDHNGLDLEIFEYQCNNNRATSFRDLIIHDDLSITALGTTVIPGNYGRNILVNINANMTAQSYFTYTYSGVSYLRHFDAFELNNGNFITYGSRVCSTFPVGDELRIEEISPNGGLTWAVEDDYCTNHYPTLGVMNTNEDSLYLFREVILDYSSSISESYLKMDVCTPSKSLVRSYNIGTSSQRNALAAPPVFDYDSNIVLLTIVSDSYLTDPWEDNLIARVVKLNRNGEILWTKDVNHFKDLYANDYHANEYLNSIFILNNNDIVISGPIFTTSNYFTSNYLQDRYPYVQRFSSDGCSSNGCGEYYLTIPEVRIDELLCFPNPASNTINFSLSSKDQEGALTIFNSLGASVLHLQNTNLSNPIDVSALPEGFYIVRFNALNHQTFTTRFVISR